MKRKLSYITILFAILFATSTLHAQNPLSFGVKAGLNLTDFAGDIKQNKLKAGYNAGIFVDYKFTENIYLLTGFEVSAKGTKMKELNGSWIDEEGNPYDMKVKQSYNPIYLQVPIHVGYKVYAIEDMTMLFHLGPYFAYGVGGKITQEIKTEFGSIKNKDNIFGKEGMMKRFDFGMGLGAGIEFKMFSLNLGYDLGITNTADNLRETWIDEAGLEQSKKLKLKNNTAHMSLAYRFQL